MMRLRTLVCSLLCASLSLLQTRAVDIDSFYDSADHYWNFHSPDAIIDTKDSLNGDVYGAVSSSTSITGTGLLVNKGAVISLKGGPGFGLGCPVDPESCTGGLSVSFLVKITEENPASGEVAFLLGNIYSNDPLDYVGKGFMIGFTSNKMRIDVVTDNEICSCLSSNPLRNIWFQFGLLWTSDKFIVYMGETKTWLHKSCMKCTKSKESRSLYKYIEVGSSNVNKPSVTAEFDNLAIWNREVNELDILNPWRFIKDNSKIPASIFLDVWLKDISWNPDLSNSGSSVAMSLQNDFASQLEELQGNFSGARIFDFRESGEGNVTAKMGLKLQESTLTNVRNLQEAFDNGTLLETRIGILNCTCNIDVFCRTPTIFDTGGNHRYIRIYFHHFLLREEIGLHYAYWLIYREHGSSSWQIVERRMSVIPPGSESADAADLKPYTNYTLQIFPFGVQGTGLGSNQIIGQTGEAGPSMAPNISSLYNTSSTSLHVTWLHDIPPAAHRGILIGYKVKWIGLSLDSGEVDVGLEAYNYTITGLLKYRSYTVSVSGRTNGGAGVENVLTAMTDDDVPSEGPDDLTLRATNSSSLVAQWAQVNLCCQNGIVLGYHVRLTVSGDQHLITNMTVDSSTFSFNFHGLITYYLYNVSVIAFTRKGDGPASEYEALTGESVPVHPPSIISAVSNSSTTITAQWTFNDSTRNVLGVLRGFTVNYVRRDGANDPEKTVTTAVSSSGTVTGLTPYTEFNVSVGAFTNMGATNSSIVIVRTLQNVPGAPPANVFAYNLSSTSIKVQWGQIPPNLQNGIILGYHVIVLLASNQSLERHLTIAQDTREANVTDLQKFTTYQVKVYGYTVIGDGNQRSLINVTTDEDVPSLPPKITAVMFNSTAIRLTLQSPPSLFIHGILRGFWVTYQRANQSSTSVSLSVPGHTLNVNLTGLNEFTYYNIQVSAFTSKGRGARSEPVLVRTDQDVPVSFPANITVLSNSTDELRLGWHPVSHDDANGILLGYGIRYKSSGAASFLERVVLPSVLETRLSNLTQYTDYEIKMATYNSKGWGPTSTVFITKTADLDECEADVDNCHSIATCVNTLGSFYCSCWRGFTGSGQSCIDINECTADVAPCQRDETCVNGDGSFICLRTTNVQDSSSCAFGSNSAIVNIDKHVNNATVLRKTDRYLFSTYVDTNCTSLQFEWKIAKATPLPFSVDTDNFTTVGHNPEWSDFRSLQNGVFLLEFVVHSDAFFFLDYGFIRVVPSPPVALIAGGSEVTRKFQSTVRLDASPSFDADLGPGNYDGLAFLWRCKRKDDVFHNSSKISSSRNESLNTSVRGCFGTERQKIEADLEGRIVSLNTSSMQVNEYYDVQLIVSKNGTKSSTFVQRIQVVTGNPLYVEINCIINCGLEVNPSVGISLVSNCTNSPCFTENARLDYHWSLFLQTNASWAEVDQLHNMIGTKFSSANLALDPNTLLPGQKYRLVLAVENLSDDSSNGSAVWPLTTSTVPSGGVCNASNASGFAVEQTFTLSCSNWDDTHQPLFYEFMIILGEGISTILSYGYSDSTEVVLPPGDPMRNYSLSIDVYISSTVGAWVKSSIEVQVLPWHLRNSQDSPFEIESFLNDSVGTFIRHGDSNGATQLTVAALKSINQQENEITSKEERIQIKSSLISLMLEVEVYNLRKLKQVSSVLALAIDDPTEVRPAMLESIMGSLQQMTSLLTAVSARQDVADALLLQIAESNLVYSLGKFIQASSGAEPSQEVVFSDKASLENNTLISLDIIRQVLRNVVEWKIPGQEPTVLKTAAMEAAVVRLRSEDALGYSLALESGSLLLPDSADMKDILAGVGGLVDIEVISSPINFFNWDPSAEFVTSRVLTVDLRSSQSGKTFAVGNLSTDIQLGIQVDAHKHVPENGTSLEKESFLRPGKMQYRKIDVTQEGTSYLVKIKCRTVLNVFVTYINKPTLENHTRDFTIPDYSSCSRNPALENVEEEYNCTRDPYTILLTNDIIQKPGVYYLGLFFARRNLTSGNHTRARRSCFSTKRQKRSCVETKDAPPSPGENEIVESVYDPRFDEKYTIETEELSCRFWSKDEQKWLIEGCKVGPPSTKHRLLCLCNHLTSFGGGLLVAPNPIDMDTVFTELSRLGETGNFGVLLTIIFVFLLYLVAVIFAWRADRRDQNKAGARVVLGIDEVLTSKQYRFTVSTGVRPDSGTTAKVTMVFYGSSGDSGPITLRPDHDPSRVLLSRGSIDQFVVSLPESLGTLRHVYIWHDNSGESASWFLDHVLVKDRETGKEWNLQCNRWFALDKDDGKIARMISVEKKNHSLNISEKFRATLSDLLYESHLWMSSVTKRPGNSFTRVQRVTCCLCVILTAMLANAMFYNLGGEPETTIRLGPLKVSTRQIVITIQSCLIIAPINFLIVAIFKNSRPSFDKHCCRKRSSNAVLADDWDLDEGDKKPLNHICAFLGWFLCFATSIASATVVFFYSLIWGKETADEWLSSILMSIVVDILAIQPVRLVVLAAVAAIVTTRAIKAKGKLSAKNRSMKEKDDSCGEIDDTPDFGNAVLPDPEQLEWYKKYRHNEAKAMSAFLSLSCFVPFLLVLGIVCYGNKDHHRFLMGEKINAIFPFAEKVTDSLGFWTWMNNIFAPGIYYGTWYNGIKEENDAYISDKVSVLIGIPRIRQLRVRKDACPEKLVKTYSTTPICLPHYSADIEDKTPMYLPGWEPFPQNASPSSFAELCPKPWRYQSAQDIGNLPQVSPRTLYGGGGYTADLGYDLQTARRVLEEISVRDWIDRQTRAVIVEFNVFNSNMNVLIVANYFFEFLPTGGVFSYRKLEMLELYSAETGFVQFILLCRLLLILITAAYLVAEIVKMYRQRSSYIGNIWNWLTLLLIITAITAVVCHIVREQTTKDVIKELHKNPYAPVSFHTAVAWVDVETVFVSVVVFLATLKLLSLVRFSKQIIFLSITMRFAGKYLLSFTTVFLIIFLSFAMCGMVAFGSTVESYSTFLRVCVSQFEFVLGKAVPRVEMVKVHPLLAFLFSLLYICSMTIFLLNVFIVIMNSALEEVKDNLFAVKDELDLALFMTVLFTKSLSNLFPKKKPKLRKLYCDNMTFEDDCYYLENCLCEINRRVTILAEDALTRSYVRLVKARLKKSPSMMENTDEKNVQTIQHVCLPLNKDAPDRDKIEKDQIEVGSLESSRSMQSRKATVGKLTSDEDVSSFSSSKVSLVVMEDSDHPLYSLTDSTTGKSEEGDKMRELPISPSDIDIQTATEDRLL